MPLGGAEGCRVRRCRAGYVLTRGSWGVLAVDSADRGPAPKTAVLSAGLLSTTASSIKHEHGVEKDALVDEDVLGTGWRPRLSVSGQLAEDARVKLSQAKSSKGRVAAAEADAFPFGESAPPHPPALLPRPKKYPDASPRPDAVMYDAVPDGCS